MVNAKSYVKTNMGQSTTDIRPSQAEHCTTVEAKACPMDGSGTIPLSNFLLDSSQQFSLALNLT